MRATDSESEIEQMFYDLGYRQSETEKWRRVYRAWIENRKLTLWVDEIKIPQPIEFCGYRRDPVGGVGGSAHAFVPINGTGMVVSISMLSQSQIEKFKNCNLKIAVPDFLYEVELANVFVEPKAGKQ